MKFKVSRGKHKEKAKINDIESKESKLNVTKSCFFAMSHKAK